MLTEKQAEFFKIILDYTHKVQDYPSIGTLKKLSNYRSYNTIHKYLNQLEKKNFIKLNSKKNKIIYLKEMFQKDAYLNIPIINCQKSLKIFKEYLKDYNYVAYKLHDNRLKSYNVFNKDILIIEQSLRNLDNKLVLVYIDSRYKVLKYQKKDGFIHLQNDKENFILTESKAIVGKVVFLIRSTMD